MPAKEQWNRFTRRLGRTYATVNRENKNLDKEKATFKKLATKQVEEDGDLARKTVTQAASSPDEAQALVEKKNPRWRVVADAVPTDKENVFEFVLEENPEYKPFVWVNDQDRQVYSKSIQAGQVQIDLDRLKENDPDLWEAVSEPSIAADATYVIEFLLDAVGFGLEDLGSEDIDVVSAVERIQLALPDDENTRTLKPEDEWTKEQEAALEEYIYEGKPVTKFLKPREATVEELESTE